VEEGEVFYSTDGVNYTLAGVLEYGELSFTPPKGLRAVKIVVGAQNFTLQTAFMDLVIE
jgi:hypothetical protein